jgi:hypothetical protein
MSLGWGFAVELVPHLVDINFWPVTPDMGETMKGLNDSVQVSATPACCRLPAVCTCCCRTA